MKKQRTVKGKLLTRIFSIIIIGILGIVLFGGLMNYVNTHRTIQTTLSEITLQTGARLTNYLSRYIAIVKEVGMDLRMGNEYSVAEKLEFLQERADTYGFTERGYIDVDGWGYETLDEIIDYREDHCYIKGMQNQEFVFGPQDLTGTPIIYFCAPMK